MYRFENMKAYDTLASKLHDVYETCVPLSSPLSALICLLIAVKSVPHLVEEDLPPARLQTGSPTFLFLQTYKLLLGVDRALAAFEKVCMDVLAC
jgi:hypothetical protein